MASLPGYLYAHSGDNLYVNLFASNHANIEMPNGSIRIRQETDYPWDGKVRITVDASSVIEKLTLNIRVPGWGQNRPVPSDLYRYQESSSTAPTLAVNGKTVSLNIEKGFARIRRLWSAGDIVSLSLPMPVRRVIAHENVRADQGKVALERGPLVFCAEWPDNKEGHVRNLLIPDDATLETEFQAGLLGGVQVISGRAQGYELEPDQENLRGADQNFMAIPYYAWAHRGRGEMAVWLARDEAAVTPLGKPTLASISEVSASFGEEPDAVNDLLEPASSNDHEVPFFHWWPHKGTTEWLQYEFPERAEVSIVEVYWFDDTGIGECRLPKTWRVLYKDGDDWKPVHTPDAYNAEKDRFNRVVFETVATTALRVQIESQTGFAGGIHELKVE
jgi:hypothetical protein